MTACGGGAERTTQEARLGGSVGDGPIIDARIEVLSVHGDLLALGTGDDLARYELRLPNDLPYPMLIRATGGIDLVSGTDADFELLAVAFDSAQTTANVTPFSTLAVRAAQCIPGGLTSENLDRAWELVQSQLSMGWDRLRLDDPLRDEITADTAANVVLINEALGEAFRRTARALAPTASELTLDDIVTSVGCDLGSDGYVDGIGGSADRGAAATFHAASVAVLLEVGSGQLRVNDVDATAAMDASVRTIFPEVSDAPTTGDVVLDEALWDVARDGLAAVQRVVDDRDLDGALVQLAAKPRTPVALTAKLVNALDSAVQNVALAEVAAQNQLLDGIAGRGRASRPAVSLAASRERVEAGVTSELTWASLNADRCIADGGWTGARPLAGRFETLPLTEDTTFGLTCIGANDSMRRTVTVVVAEQIAAPPFEPSPPSEPVPVAPTLPDEPQPEVSLVAIRASIEPGATTGLLWSSKHATSCAASGGWVGARSLDGIVRTAPLYRDTAFVLTCTGPSGSAAANVTIDVLGDATLAPPPAEPQGPALVFDANAASVVYGGSVTLNWSSQRANACVASGDWSGPRAQTGTMIVGPLRSDAQFTLSCAGVDGGDSISAIAVIVKSAKLNWTEPSENQDGSPISGLAGYRIYHGSAPGNYEQIVEITDPTVTNYRFDLPSGAHFFVVGAIAADGVEGVNSNEVSKIVP